MDFSHYSDQPVQTAVDLVNTYDQVQDLEKLPGVHALGEFLDEHAGDRDRASLRPNERDLHEIRALRARLREVFTSPDVAAAAAVLNEILADTDAVPRVSVHGAGPHLHFESDADGLARWLGAITAVGLSVALIEGGFERFGICASSACDDVFVDSSRNRSKRHCSDTCTSRENVAAFRARHAED